MKTEYAGVTGVLALTLLLGSIPPAEAGILQLDRAAMHAELDNGILDIAIRFDGTVEKALYKGHDLIKDRAPGKTTFYLDYNTGHHAYAVIPNQLRVLENTDEAAHVAYVDTQSILGLEYHYIMKRGDSGLYSYVIARNNLPESLHLAEMRTVYRLDRSLFDHAYTLERDSLIPRQEVMHKGKKLQDETYDMGAEGEKYTNGPIYEKYDYAAYLADTPFWGAYGHGLGFWVMPVSNEYHPGGPLKQDLTVHYDTIVCNYLTSAHFGTPEFDAPVGWEKMYGPWYVYVNEGTPEQVKHDAARREQRERRAWPYAWVREKDYPVARGSVCGCLQLSDGRPAADAQVILARPGADVTDESDSYLFAARTDAHGRFKVSKVRPGEYELQAYFAKAPQAGQPQSITDTFRSPPFRVSAQGAKLPTLVWPVGVPEVVWQIGTADHRADEFAYGGEPRNYKWHQMVPADLDYDVATSTAAQNWYYVQSRPGRWNIHFTLPASELQQHDYEFVLALAGYSTGMGKQYATVDAGLLLNGQPLQQIKYPNDKSVYRCSTTSGTYHRMVVKLPRKLLQPGANTLTIENRGASLMYDTLLLQKKQIRDCERNPRPAAAAGMMHIPRVQFLHIDSKS